MFTRNTAHAILALCILSLALAVLCYHIGKAQPLPYNPYAPLLATLPDTARCYGDLLMSSNYCTLQYERGYIAYGVDDSGIRSVSTRGVYHVQLGTLIALYGQPTRTNKLRFQVSYSWILESEGLRIVAFVKRDSLFSEIVWVLFLVV